MKYYIHIDESGPFDEAFSGVRASVVGGVCSTNSADEWAQIHREHLDEFSGNNPDSQLDYPSHYHCGPLLAGKLGAPTGSHAGMVGDFADGVFHNVLTNAKFGFLSRNVGKKFQYSPQATYVMNLIAALRNSFKLLGQSVDDIEQIHVVIAQRTIGETSKAGTVALYMSFLLTHVMEQLLVGDGAGVVLARRLHTQARLNLSTGLGDRNAGLIAADFVCCLGRNGRKANQGSSLHVWQPDEDALLGDYRSFHERQALVLIKNKYYGSCLDFMCRYFPLLDGQPDVKSLVEALRREIDQQVLQRELPALLSVIHQISKNRTQAPNMLAVAIRVAERLVDIASKHSTADQNPAVQRHWLNFHIQALAELSACYNHTGSVGPQAVVEHQLTDLLSKRGKDTGMGATHRQSLLIDVRNRNLNLLFNDYRFEEAYSLAEELSVARNEMIPVGEADELLGQILGSHGQACAFMARFDGSWYDSAVELFERSLEHFATGSYQEEMSRNFLVTTAWQDWRLDDAVTYMNTTAIPGPTTLDPVDTVSALLSRPSPQSRAFDVVNCLRLAAAYSHRDNRQRLDDGLRGELESIAKSIASDHPYEQWLKWLGILHLQCEDFAKAESCFAAATEICRKSDFTMQTIGNSIELLQVVGRRIRTSGKASKNGEQNFHLELKRLRAQSTAYDAYIQRSQLIELLELPVKEFSADRKNLWKTYTILPFAYA